MATETLTGAQALIRSLELLGVDTVFGLPGGAILPTYDPLMDSKKLRHILVRHEQGAGNDDFLLGTLPLFIVVMNTFDLEKAPYVCVCIHDRLDQARLSRHKKRCLNSEGR